MYDNYAPEPAKRMSTGAKIGIGCGGCLGVTVLGGAFLLVLGALASSSGAGSVSDVADPTPSPSATQSEEDVRPVKDEEPEEEDVPDFQVDGTQVLNLVLSSGWEELSASERSDVCFGWGLDSGMMTDAFVEGFGSEHEDVITEEEVRKIVADFYNDKCE